MDISTISEADNKVIGNTNIFKFLFNANSLSSNIKIFSSATIFLIFPVPFLISITFPSSVICLIYGDALIENSILQLKLHCDFKKIHLVHFILFKAFDLINHT